MKLDLDFPSKSPFLPAFSLPLCITKFERYEELGRLVLEKEQEILDSTNPDPENGPRDWLTNRLYDYNLLDYADEYPVLNEFKAFILESYIEYCRIMNAPIESPVYVTCWANVIRNNGRTISAHSHSDSHKDAPEEYSYVSGNICVAADDTRTYYQNPFLPKHLGKGGQAYGIKNIPGEATLFPAWTMHWVDEHHSSEPRVSIAFDIITEEVYNLPSKRKPTFRKL